MTPPGNKSFTRSGKFSTLRKLFTKRRNRPSLPIHDPQEKSENRAISNAPLTESPLNQDPEQRNSAQIQKKLSFDANLTSRTIEAVLLVSEELDALTSHRQALDSLAAKFKDALAKVHNGNVTNDIQVLTPEDDRTFSRVLEPVTEAEQHACDVTWSLFGLLCRMVRFDVMMAAERDCKKETRTLVDFLLKLGLDQGYRSSASNAQKLLFEKVAKLCTQYVDECKPDAKDDVPNGVTPKDAAEDAARNEDTAKDDVLKVDASEDVTPRDEVPRDEIPKDDAVDDDTPAKDASDGGALDHDALYHKAPKQVGENILLVAGRFKLLELEPLTTDALGNTQKQILAEIAELCSDFHSFGNDRGEAEMDENFLAVEEIQCLAKSINRKLGYILAKVERKPENRRRELTRLVDLNLNHWMDECRKDVKSVEEKESTGSPQNSKDRGTQMYVD